MKVAGLVFVLMQSVLLSAVTGAARAEDDGRRASLWVDLYRGEPVRYEDMLGDLAGVRVIYLGECHSVKRHHEIQARLVADLGQRGLPLILALEQMESLRQPQLDRYNRREIDFEQLAEATDWPARWEGYQQYRSVLETARQLGAPIVALNAQRETIQQVARAGGIDKLEPQLRKELPADVQQEDPLYERLLNLQLMVHALATPERLRPMVEAQIARDEVMAFVLCTFLQSEAARDRTAVVLCGAGHVAYGLGTAARVRRRLPGIKDRIILLSESGDLELSPAMEAMARDIEITHEQLRQINRPIADYLHAKGLKPDKDSVD